VRIVPIGVEFVRLQVVTLQVDVISRVLDALRQQYPRYRKDMIFSALDCASKILISTLLLKAIGGIIPFFDEEEANEWDEGMRSICNRTQFAAADGPDEPLSNES